MALAPGGRLAHYEIMLTLGAGGMGEVFRARDTEALAALSHANIAAIYGLDLNWLAGVKR